jgi:hypothetical protein
MGSIALVVTETENGFDVVDNLGRHHSVSSEGLADLCKTLANDEALPSPDIQDLDTAQLEFAMTQLTQRFLPDGLEFLARPALITLRNTVEAFRHPLKRTLHVRRG